MKPYIDCLLACLHLTLTHSKIKIKVIMVMHNSMVADIENEASFFCILRHWHFDALHTFDILHTFCTSTLAFAFPEPTISSWNYF